MELALSLGDSTKQPFPFLDKNSKMASSSSNNNNLGFCMGFGEKPSEEKSAERFRVSSSSSDPPLQLDLLPFSPVPRSQRPSNPVRFPWLHSNLGNESSSFSGGTGKRLDMNNFPLSAAAADEEDDAAARVSASPPNSSTSSFRLDFGMIRTAGKNKRCDEAETERSGSRPSDDDENGSTRKKLRLSKEQSAFLEESFKEHNTLNPKQKLALAKQLNLLPRQVEVWFQNRRARTKLKQTEVDCEYLKRCCETLTEENRRLQKELQELRALKTSRPFYMQLPATTLTMCPSCERVATTTATTPPAATTAMATTGLSLATSGNSSRKAQQAHQSS